MINGKDDFLKSNSDFLVQLLFNLSIDGILVIDMEGVVQLANSKAKKIFSNIVDPLEGHLFGIPVFSDPVEIQVNQSGELRTIEMEINRIKWRNKDAYLAILRDITDKVYAQSELRVREQQYRQLFNNSINGFILSEIILDESKNPIDYIFLDVNQAFEIMFGLKKEDILNKSVLGLFPFLRSTELSKSFENVSKTGEAERLVFHFDMLQKDFMIAVYSPLPGKVAAVFSDITERVIAENKLRKSEKRYRTLFETMSQGVIYVDREGKLISVNPAAERIIGKDLKNQSGSEMDKSEYDIVRLDMTPFPEYKFPQNIALRTGRRVEDCVLGVKLPYRQEHSWVSASAIPQFREGESEPYQIIITFLDITDRIRVQKTLQERVKELNCISRISNAIQKEISLDEVCQFAVREIVNAMQHPEIAIAVIEFEGKKYLSREVFEETAHQIKTPIRTKDLEFGEISVYYSEERPFALPEEFNFLNSVAERLASYYVHLQTQEQLRRSEERFRKAIIDAPIPIMIFTDDGEILTVNNAWVRTAGYERAEIPTLFDWLRKAHGEEYEEILDQILINPQTNHGIQESNRIIITRSGEKRIWQITTSPLETLPDGRKTILTMARDITERRQAELEREQYYDRITSLREVDKVIGSTLDLDNVLDRITSEMQRLIAFDSMTVMLLSGGKLNVIACQGFENSEEILSLSFPSSPEYPNYEVVEEKRPVYYENISDTFPVFHQLTRGFDAASIKAWLGVPLIHQGEVIGMFTIDHYKEGHFSEDDVSIAMEFANRAAIAITNAQLYEKTIWQIKKLEILRKIDAVITGSMNLPSSLVEILTYIQEGLKVDAVSIILYDEEKEMLVSARGVGFKSEVDSSVEVKLGQGFSGHVALEREPLFIPDITFKRTKFKYPVDLKKENITSYYGVSLIARGKLEGVLQVYSHERLNPDQDWITFADALAGQAAVAVYNIALFADLEQANKDLIQAYDATIEGWAHALELRDKETSGHSRRVVDLTVKIAHRFGFDEEALHHIRRGVLLHDIGKMGIPDDILQKPGPLTEEEWDIMREHPGFAYDMLKDIDYLVPALTIPHYHHERWDGSGYPEGLAGEEIPLEARIFAVVDIWDALTSKRYYRDAWSREKTLEYIKDEAGILLDPDVVAVFLEIIEGDQAGSSRGRD